MTDLNQHAFARPNKSVPWGDLMYEMLHHLLLCDQLSQSTMCGGLAINHTFQKENPSSNARVIELPVRLDYEWSLR